MSDALAALPTYRTDLFNPTYRPMRTERWELRISDTVFSPGYWSGPSLVHNLAALISINEDGSTNTWMSSTPMEHESQEIGVRAAAGHTVVMGMGMGWAAANIALNPAVTRVTVVDLDQEVIDTIQAIGVFEQLPAEAAAKVTIVHGDATAYVPDAPVDTLFADIWRPINGDRIPEMHQMQANCKAPRVYYWGQELEIARRARTLGLPINGDTVARIVADIGLPLIGPERADYPALIEAAAARWLKDI
ncbi:MAG TPA: hypothetical protein VD995_33465 [Azospirillum sp.]|nr:hypothetical protein [Azospirillum sp.]